MTLIFLATNDSNLHFNHSTLQANQNVFCINSSTILVYKSIFSACNFKKSSKNLGGFLLVLNSNTYGQFLKIEIICMYNRYASIISIINSKFYLKSSYLLFNQGLQGGILKLGKGSTLLLEDNHFFINEAYEGGICFAEEFTSLIAERNNFFFGIRPTVLITIQVLFTREKEVAFSL